MELNSTTITHRDQERVTKIIERQRHHYKLFKFSKKHA